MTDIGVVKRFFRAKNKICAADLVSHITQRAAGKEPLFIEDDDFLYFIYLLKNIAKKQRIGIYAFCLMQNHAHILLRPKERNLDDAMRNLFSKYAMRFNRKYERKGHLFGGPYRQAICLDDAYLLTASLYIHLNPVKAGLCQHSLAYQWSTASVYCSTDDEEHFVVPYPILGLLEGVTGNAMSRQQNARIKYLKLLERSKSLRIEDVIEQEDAINRFRNQLARLFPRLFKDVGECKVATYRAKLKLKDLFAIEREIEIYRNEKKTTQVESRKAKKFIIEQLISRGYKRYEIAEKLNISVRTVYNLLKTS